MCSTTTPRAAPQRATPLGKIKKNATLASFLNAAYQKVRANGDLGPDIGLKTHIPISIYLRSTGTDHIYAGNSVDIGGTLHRLDLEEFYSASLIKVAAMFAAYTLRREADVLRTDMRDGIVDVPLSKFFDKLAERVNPADDALPEITKAAKIKINNIPMAPSLRDILSITSLTDPVTFTDDFQGHLRRMIIISRDCDTAECIFRLSYPYINLKLMNEGYFHRDARKGIWLCGDYFPPGGCANEAKQSKLQYKATGQAFLRIDTVNDCDQTQTPPFCGSAQNTTSKDMARLFLNILLQELVDQPSAHEMLLLLNAAENGDDSSFLDEDDKNSPNPINTHRASGSVEKEFSIVGVKIGQGGIKTDPDRGAIEVRSEGLIIKWNHITEDEKSVDKDLPKALAKALAKDFDKDLRKQFDDKKLTGEAAICWQNLSASTPNTDGIIEIINESIFNFVTQ